MRCLYVCVGALYFGEMTILETWLSQHMILQTLHVHTRRDWWKWPTPYSNHLSKSPELDLRVLMLPPIHPYSQLIPGHWLKSAGEFFTSQVIPGSYPFTEIWSSASLHRLFLELLILGSRKSQSNLLLPKVCMLMLLLGCRTHLYIGAGLKGHRIGVGKLLANCKYCKCCLISGRYIYAN